MEEREEDSYRRWFSKAYRPVVWRFLTFILSAVAFATISSAKFCALPADDGTPVPLPRTGGRRHPAAPPASAAERSAAAAAAANEISPPSNSAAPVFLLERRPQRGGGA